LVLNYLETEYKTQDLCYKGISSEYWDAVTAPWALHRALDRHPNLSEREIQQTHKTMASFQTDPPENLPEELINVLQNSADSQLREVINYGQQLLRERPPITEEAKSRSGEELVRVMDRGPYTIAMVVRSGRLDKARGPFAYRVKWEPNIQDEGGQYKWHYLGKVYDDSGREWK